MTNCVCVCVCVCVSVCGQSHGSISSSIFTKLDTCKPPKVRTSLLGVNIAPPLPPFSPKNPQFWGVNRRFRAKLAKSKNVHIFKTTASIPTNFCTVIKTTKCPLWVVPTHALQIQDGGRPPSWKNRETVISAAVRAILTKFGKMMHFEPLDRPGRLKFKILQIQDGCEGHLENRKIAVSQLRFERFRRNLAWWRSSALVTVWPVTEI